MSGAQLTFEEVRERVDQGLPVRLSIRETDPSFDVRALGLSGRVAVYLDGRELEWATSWDVPAGEVVRERRNQAGDLVLEHGAPAFETLHGRVEVRWIRAVEEKGRG